MSLRVVVTDYTFPSLEPEERVLAAADTTVEGHQCRNEEEVLAAISPGDTVLVQFAPITRRVLEKLGEGATVVRYGVGVDNIDLGAAADVGVAVAYVPDYCTNEVADHTVSLLLTLLRRLPMLDASVRSGSWSGIQVAQPLPPLETTVIGLLGLGRIGNAVVGRLRAFGCRFLVFDPYLTPERAQQAGVEQAPLDTVLREADALTLHLPLTDATRHVLNSETITQMKPNAVVVNTARGELIDAGALAAALRQGRLRAAGLDVFEKEPLPSDSPLRDLANVVLTPHIAWYSGTAMERLQRLAAEECVRALSGEPLRCPVGR